MFFMYKVGILLAKRPSFSYIFFFPVKTLLSKRVQNFKMYYLCKGNKCELIDKSANTLPSMVIKLMCTFWLSNTWLVTMMRCCCVDVG